jgi:hypothetical protein
MGEWPGFKGALGGWRATGVDVAWLASSGH